jgi:hypothetical protein
MWGSKELFSISVSTQIADQATSASLGVCESGGKGLPVHGLKSLLFGRLGILNRISCGD